MSKRQKPVPMQREPLAQHHKLDFAISTLEVMLRDTEEMRKTAEPMERVSLALIIESYAEAIKVLTTYRTVDKSSKTTNKEEK